MLQPIMWYEKSDSDRELYGEASGYGANEVVLASRLSAQSFVAAKKSGIFFTWYLK